MISERAARIGPFLATELLAQARRNTIKPGRRATRGPALASLP